MFEGFPGGSDSKESTCNIGDPGLILGLGRSPGEGNGNSLQYLVWKITWTEESGGLQSRGSQELDMPGPLKPAQVCLKWLIWTKGENSAYGMSQSHWLSLWVTVVCVCVCVVFCLSLQFLKIKQPWVFSKHNAKHKYTRICKFCYEPRISTKQATGLEKVSFHSNPKERQCQRMFRFCTI